ncbi:MAG: 1-acyl-sn-glycerol-3-phosphate acyltransferase, partial [Planctomycetes bacterium]|nr:1-acyl-sn-glycerol-3-phosphate acyltransferase [Planctomycetota bacterium]
TCGLTFEVLGLENVPAEPAVVLCKHQSAWETLGLQLVFSPQVWVLKRELLWIPFFGWGLAMMRPIAIDRSAGRRAVEQVVEQGRERLESGNFVVVFPEGTRVPPGYKRRYKQGGATLAQRSGRAVVPVAVNSGEYWPRNSFLKHPGRITMVVGPPIDTTGLGSAQINARAEAWIEDTVARISNRPPAVELPATNGARRQEKA